MCYPLKIYLIFFFGISFLAFYRLKSILKYSVLVVLKHLGHPVTYDSAAPDENGAPPIVGTSSCIMVQLTFWKLICEINEISDEINL